LTLEDDGGSSELVERELLVGVLEAANVGEEHGGVDFLQAFPAVVVDLDAVEVGEELAGAIEFHALDFNHLSLHFACEGFAHGGAEHHQTFSIRGTGGRVDRRGIVAIHANVHVFQAALVPEDDMDQVTLVHSDNLAEDAGLLEAEKDRCRAAVNGLGLLARGRNTAHFFATRLFGLLRIFFLDPRRLGLISETQIALKIAPEGKALVVQSKKKGGIAMHESVDPNG
jgi:hypothetical protein